ncbi:MAG: polymer-forming cytoskeletal protein [Rhodanobacter sp.]
MLNRKRNEQRSANQDTSLIARGTVIQGDVRFTGVLHLDGRIEGVVQGEGEDAMFTLSEHGQVEGEIRVPHAVINGHVTGNVDVSVRLELAAQACIDGDVRYQTMEMVAGAQVNGRIARQATESTRELPAPGLATHEEASSGNLDDAVSA